MARTLESIRQESWKEAVLCYGSFAVFEKRYKLLRNRLRWLAFLGIALPASLGATAATFGLNSALTAVCLTVAGALGIFQIIWSVWSLASGWGDSFAYAREAMTANRRFYQRFRALAEHPPKLEDAERTYELLQTESEARSGTDDQQGVTDKEKRYGMRAGLMETSKECTGCRKIPTSMRPTECDVCGRF